MNKILFIGGVSATTLGFAWVVGGLPLATLAAVAFGVQWVALPIAFAARSEKFYDLTGSLTYLTLLGLAMYAAEHLSMRSILLVACVAVWALLSHRPARVGGGPSTRRWAGRVGRSGLCTVAVRLRHRGHGRRSEVRLSQQSRQSRALHLNGSVGLVPPSKLLWRNRFMDGAFPCFRVAAARP